MFVCMCFGVTDTEVNARIADGARTMREIARSCGAGTDCGRCVKGIAAMLPRDRVRRGGGCPAAGSCPVSCAAAAETPESPEGAVPLPVPLMPSAPSSGGGVRPLPPLPVPAGATIT